MNHQRSSLLSFFIYNTEYGNREGHEEEKILLYIPQEEGLDKKIKTIGLCQALSQFVLTFNPNGVCECLITQKCKQFYINPESNFWLGLTLSIPFLEKTVKDKKIVEYFPDDLQASIAMGALKQAYDMFVLFNGSLMMILEKHGLDALRERFEFFYTRYLQTLNFGQLDLLDIYQGINYLPLDKSDFLKLHCFSNHVETTLKSVQHICALHNDQLLWTTLNCKNLQILFKYLTTSLLPSVNEGDGDKASPMSSQRSSPNNIVNPGKLLTAPLELINPGSSTPKRAPRVFVDVQGENCQLYLIVYKCFSTTLCLLVDLKSLTVDFCMKLHSMLGAQLANLSSIISEQSAKKLPLPSDQQYRFIYFNSMNLAIKSSIHGRRYIGLTSVSPDIMKLLIDIHKDLGKFDTSAEIIAKNTADCWVVGKRSGFREFFVVLNQKNAGLVEINEEVNNLVSTSFFNIFFVN